MEILSYLIIFPVGALLVGVLFLSVGVARRKVLPTVAGALWSLYGVYESLMYARILCTGECNIRVDLLLIYPVLLLATVLGIVGAIGKKKKA